MIKVHYKAVLAGLCVAALGAVEVRAAGLSFVGSDKNIGGTFFASSGKPANEQSYWVVPWRTETPKAYDLDGNNVYGSDGYAMFGTEFQYPEAYPCCGSAVSPTSATHPNIISLPSYVSASQFLVNAGNSKVGGWGYALVDDPRLTNGYRDYNWGDSQVPPANPPHSQAPYVKIGILEGPDIFGNNARNPGGAGRWAFTVGANAPSRIRVGVMTDGLDAEQWSSAEVLLHQVVGTSIIGTATTGAISQFSPGTNRFVDIHTFDIVGAQAGDTFAIFSKAFSSGQGGISAVTFDAAPVPEPASLVVGAIALAIGSCCRNARNRARS
jgi:hypothetical protein